MFEGFFRKPKSIYRGYTIVPTEIDEKTVDIFDHYTLVRNGRSEEKTRNAGRIILSSPSIAYFNN